MCDKNAGDSQETFELAEPALVCRWRLARKHVPLLNRHVRALSARRVNGGPLGTNMLSWVKQHVEWSVAEGSYPEADGVLMLVVDVTGQAAMRVGAYEPLPSTEAAALVERAASARVEQGETGVAPELLAYAGPDGLTLVAGEDEALCGAASLAAQLAETRGMAVGRAAAWDKDAPELLLISDEHGVVSADGFEGPVGAFLSQGFETLRAKA